MRIALIAALALYTVGLISKFFHLPLNAIIMMFGLLGMIVILAIGIITKKFNGLYALAWITTTFWLTTLLATLKFWGPATIFFVISTLLSAITFTVALRSKQFKYLIPVGVSLLLCLTFYKMPTDTRYYLVSIKWNHEVSTDYFSWDKYSWFLYKNGKYKEALMASNKAFEMAVKANEMEWVESISDHKERIKNRNWNQFH